MTVGERKRGGGCHCKAHLPKHFSLWKLAPWRSRVTHSMQFITGNLWEIEIQSYGFWVTDNIMNQAFIMHLLRKESFKHGWSPLLVDFIEISPRCHWQHDLLIDEWHCVERWVWRVRCFQSPVLCGVGDVLRRYTVLLPFFKMNVCFYVRGVGAQNQTRRRVMYFFVKNTFHRRL